MADPAMVFTGVRHLSIEPAARASEHEIDYRGRAGTLDKWEVRCHDVRLIIPGEVASTITGGD
jgi:hypothetical protein